MVYLFKNLSLCNFIWLHTIFLLIAQLNNLWYCSLGLCIHCLDFHTQITRKYSTAMCYIWIGFGWLHSRLSAPCHDYDLVPYRFCLEDPLALGPFVPAPVRQPPCLVWNQENCNLKKSNEGHIRERWTNLRWCLAGRWSDWVCRRRPPCPSGS